MDDLKITICDIREAAGDPGEALCNFLDMCHGKTRGKFGWCEAALGPLTASYREYLAQKRWAEFMMGW